MEENQVMMKMEKILSRGDNDKSGDHDEKVTTESTAETNTDSDDRIEQKREECCDEDDDYLPFDFAPGCNDVIIGRGKKYSTYEGNIKLRKIVASKLSEYTSAENKRDKSNALQSVISEVKSREGLFIKRDLKKQRWCKVIDFVAKEKVSQFFRDALEQKYKSSTASRKKIRIEKKKQLTLRKQKEKEAMLLLKNNNEQYFQQKGSGTTQNSLDRVNRNLDQLNRQILALLTAQKNHNRINLSNNVSTFNLDYQSLQCNIPLQTTFSSLEKETVVSNCFGENPYEPRPMMDSSLMSNIPSSSALDEELLEDIDLSGLDPTSSNQNFKDCSPVGVMPGNLGTGTNTIATLPFDFLKADERIRKKQSSIMVTRKEDRKTPTKKVPLLSPLPQGICSSNLKLFKNNLPGGVFSNNWIRSPSFSNNQMNYSASARTA